MIEINEEEFTGFRASYFGAEMIWRNGVKRVFINLDNIQNIIFEEKKDVLTILMAGSENIIINSKKANNAYSELLKIYQDAKMNFRPYSMECKATSCNYS
ncbi:hypothetical protein [Marinoscillum pacificum]|uniref:hypothetical protein n=1 Tax=Marinoscillum pacificum TaxID=392723 RepID=UPI00215837C8|nr:hypothetical protein [Marinoscillum pacificum]